MANLYNNIENLCKKRGVNMTTMCRDSGASRGSLSDLKSGRKQTLKYETLKKIANYFEMSVESLVSGDDGQKEKPAPGGSELDAAFSAVLDQLTAEELAEVLEYAKFKVASRKGDSNG